MTLVLNGSKRAAPLLTPASKRGFRPLQVTPAMQAVYDKAKATTQSQAAKRQEPPMFRSPEHCMRVAFAFQQMRIEPRNATAAVIDSLRERSGELRTKSELTQHDWHAQATMALSFIRRVLEPHPMLWSIVQAEYGHDIPSALALQLVSVEAAPKAESRDRLIADALTCNLLRGTPKYRQISDSYDISLDALSRRARVMRPVVLGLRDRATAELLAPMRESGLIA